MSVRAGVGSVAVAVAVGVAPAFGTPALEAQSRADSACATQIRRDPSTASCTIAANMVVSLHTEASRRRALLLGRVSPRDVQSRTSGDASAAGPSNSEGVATTTPVALASASLSAVGSGGGNDGIAAISLNPVMLFASPDPQKQMKWSRLADITLLTPVNRDSSRSGDYFGIRARVNLVVGAEKHLEALAEEQARLTTQNATAAAELRRLFEESATPAQCVAAHQDVSGFDRSRVVAACGRYVEVVNTDAALERFRNALSAYRDSVDRTYFGADVRLDRGDPTLGEVDGYSGTALGVGIAFGWGFPGKPDGIRRSLRGRVGFVNVQVDSGVVATDTVGQTFEAALALSFEKPTEFRPIRIVAGVNYADSRKVPPGLEQVLRASALDIVATLELPLSDATSLVMSYTSPSRPGGQSRLSVNFNWQMLLPETGAPVLQR